jgi:peptide/nickel transport system permease protein
MVTSTDTLSAAEEKRGRADVWSWASRHKTIVAGLAILVALVVIAIAAPWLSGDPLQFEPTNRLKRPSGQFWFGTDQFGRDVYSRVIHGTRISLIVGLSVSLLATAVGLFVGVICGYYKRADGIIMRIMDGMMAIPSILLAIALITLMKASLLIVIIAITVPEVPRIARLVRSVVLSVRTRPFIDAAIACGTSNSRIMVRHILPNTVAPLIVQATYVCASAILTEAGLSFLGAGTPPEIPSWGNVISLGRTFFQIAPWIIFFPGIFLAVTVLAINLVGDGLRDMLDPRIARGM